MGRNNSSGLHARAQSKTQSKRRKRSRFRGSPANWLSVFLAVMLTVSMIPPFQIFAFGDELAADPTVDSDDSTAQIETDSQIETTGKTEEKIDEGDSDEAEEIGEEGLPQSYSVEYKDASGTLEVAAATYDAGATVDVAFPDAAREGYTFEGWATTLDGAAVYTEAGTVSFTLEGDTVLHAVWKELSDDGDTGTGDTDDSKDATDKDDEDGTDSSDAESTDKNPATNPANPDNKDSKKAPSTNKPKPAPKALTYTVIFVANGKTWGQQVLVPENSSVEEPEAPTPEDTDYWPADMVSFRGWFAAGSRYDFSQPVTAPLILVADFSNSYLISYKDGADKVVFSRELAPNANVLQPPQSVLSEVAVTGPTSEHYVDYWYVEGGDENERYLFGAEKATGDLTLVPKFDNRHYVLFVSEGSQVAEPVQMVADGEFVTEPVSDPTRAGYEFSYWSTTESANTSLVSSEFDFANTAITENTTLYAVWEALPVDYTVSVWMEKADILDADEVLAHPNGDKSQYDYVTSIPLEGISGTESNVSGTDAGISELFTDHPLLKYAEFQDVEQQTIRGNGLTVVNLYAKRKVYTYTFDLGSESRWVKVGDETYFGDDYQLRAKYEQNVTGLLPVRGIEDEGVEFGPADTFNFRHWTYDKKMTASGAADGTGALLSRRNVIDKDLLSADGAVLNYTFTVNVLKPGESLPGKVRYYAEKLPEEGATPENSYSWTPPGSETAKTYILMEEYNQDGVQASMWAKAMVGLTQLNQKTPEYDSVDTSLMRFFYSRNPYPLKFDMMAGSDLVTNIPESETLLFGESLANYEPTDTPEREGYTFDGWYRDDKYYEEFDFANTVVPNSEVIVYAKWESDAYEVAYFDSLGGDEVVREGVARGEYAQENPYTNGQIVPGKGAFIGWFFDSAGKLVPFSNEIPVYKNYDLFAQWKTDGFEVTYKEGEGTGTVPVDDDDYELGVGVRVLDAPDLVGPELADKPGSYEEFYAWEDESGATIYPGNIIELQGDTVLTALYADPADLVTLTYIENYEGSTTDFVVRAYPGETVTLAGEIFTRPESDQKLTGWATSATGTAAYQLSESYEVTSSATFYGVWAHAGYTITFLVDEAEGNFPTGEVTEYTGIPRNTAWDTGWEPEARPNTPNTHYFVGWDKPIPETVTENLIFKAVFAERTNITITAASDEKPYDGSVLTNDEVTVTSGALKPGDELVATAAPAAALVNVGTTDNRVVSTGESAYKITRNGADVTGEYIVTPVPGILEIIPVALTVTASATPDTVQYNTTEPVYEYAIETMVNGEDRDTVSPNASEGTLRSRITLVETYTPGGLFDTENRENNRYTITPTGPNAWGNYTLTYVVDTFEVVANTSMFVLVESEPYTYDGQWHTASDEFASANVENAQLLYAVAASPMPDGSPDNPDWEPEGVSYLSALSDELIRDVGVVYIWVKAERNGYADAYNSGFVTVNPADLTLIGETLTVPYNNPARASYGVSFSGFVNGENESVLVGGPFTATSTYTQGDPAGTVLPVIPNTYGQDPYGNNRNYHLNYQNGTLTVGKSGALSVELTDVTEEYDGLEHSLAAPVAAVSDGGVVPTDVSYTYARWDEELGEWVPLASAPSLTGVASMRVQVTASSANYADVTDEAMLTVTHAPLDITGVATPDEIDYLDEAPLLSWEADADDFVNDEDASVLEGVVITPSTDYESGDLNGTYDVKVSGPATYGNYALNYNQGSFIVHPLEGLSVSLANYTADYNGAPQTFRTGAVAYLDGEPVPADMIEYSADGVEWNTSLPTRINIGETEVQVRAAVQGYVNATTSATITITRKLVTVTADNASFTFGDSAPDYTWTVTGLVPNETEEVHLAGANIIATDDYTAPDVPGTYEITVNGETYVGNYRLSYEPGVLTVNPRDGLTLISFGGGTYPYNGLARSLPNEAVFEADLDDVEIDVMYSTTGQNGTYSSDFPTRTDQGQTTVWARATANGFVDEYASAELIITRAPLTVTATATPETVEYNTVTPAYSWEFDGLVNNEEADDVLTGDYSANSTYVPGDEDFGLLGFHDVVASGPEVDGNYTLTYVDGSFEVVANTTMTVALADRELVYDGTSLSLLPAVASLPGATITYAYEEVSGAAVPPTYTFTGTYPATATASRYGYVDATDEATLTITARPLGIVSSAATKVYDGDPLSSDDYTLAAGTIPAPGDFLASVASSGSQTVVGTAQSLHSNAVVMRDGADVTANYAINYVPATLQVTAAPLTVTAADLTLVAGTALPAEPGYTASGFVNGEDDAVLSGDPVYTTDYTPAAAADSTWDLDVRGLSADNYSISWEPGTITVTAAPVVPGPGPVPVVPAAVVPGPAAPVAPAAPADVPEVVIDDPAAPLADAPAEETTIEDEETPLAAATAHWAFINLALSVLGILAAVVLFVANRARRKDDEDSSEEDASDDSATTKKRRLAFCIVSAVLAVAAILLFIFTQDLSLPMGMMDSWTVVHAVIFVLQLVCFVFVRRRSEDEDDSSAGTQTPVGMPA